LKIDDQMKIAWLNTRELPALARWFIRCGMIICPIFIVVLVLPWLPSTALLPAAVWMALLAIGCWGVAARRPSYRWVLVLSSFATEAASLFYVPLRLTDIASAGWWSIVVYISLFHVRSIRAYFGEDHSTSAISGKNVP
jgi:hypothetical protein